MSYGIIGIFRRKYMYWKARLAIFFYVGFTTLSLHKRMSCHVAEAYNVYGRAYNSPKNRRIRQERGLICLRMLFYAFSHVEWYELACIEVLGEKCQLANVRRDIHKCELYVSLHEYHKMVQETRDKLQAYFTLYRISPIGLLS
jgi:hypothetical protein